MIWIKISVYAIVLILLFIAVFLFKSKIQIIYDARDRLAQMYDKLAAGIELQSEEMDKNYALQGASDSSSFLTSVENLLKYSRVSVKYPLINVTNFLLAEVIVTCAVFIVSSIFTNFLVAIALALLCILIPVGVLRKMADINYKKTQQQFVPFINMISTASQSSNDLLSLLEESCIYVGEPICSTVADAVSEARESGNIGNCIRSLSLKLEYELFGRFIRSLEICSRRNSNFKKIADDFRPDAEAFISSDAKIDSIYSNGRILCLALILLSFGAIMICGNIFKPVSVFEVIGFFLNGFIGNAVLAVIILIYVLALLLLKKRRRR